VANPLSAGSSDTVLPPVGMRWVAVNVSLRSESQHGYQGGMHDFSIVGSDGLRYADSAGVTLAGSSTRDSLASISLYRVQPSSTVTGAVIFKIPIGVNPLTLRFYDSTATRSQKADYLAWNI
jgi:hypothetical protein